MNFDCTRARSLRDNLWDPKFGYRIDQMESFFMKITKVLVLQCTLKTVSGIGFLCFQHSYRLVKYSLSFENH